MNAKYYLVNHTHTHTHTHTQKHTIKISKDMVDWIRCGSQIKELSGKIFTLESVNSSFRKSLGIQQRKNEVISLPNKKREGKMINCDKFWNQYYISINWLIERGREKERENFWKLTVTHILTSVILVQSTPWSDLWLELQEVKVCL